MLYDANEVKRQFGPDFPTVLRYIKRIIAPQLWRAGLFLALFWSLSCRIKIPLWKKVPSNYFESTGMQQEQQYFTLFFISVCLSLFQQTWRKYYKCCVFVLFHFVMVDAVFNSISVVLWLQWTPLWSLGGKPWALHHDRYHQGLNLGIKGAELQMEMNIFKCWSFCKIANSDNKVSNK